MQCPDINKFKELYLNENVSISIIKKEFNIKYNSYIYQWAKELNLPKIDRLNKRSKIDINELTYLSKIENKSTKEIADIFDCNPETIRQLLKENNIEGKKQGGQRKYVINENYFSEPMTLKKARILGLIATDGNVLYNANAGSYVLSFTSLDKELCDFFVSEIGGNVTPDINKHCFNYKCISRKIFFDLQNFGIKPRKSLNLKINFQFFTEEEKYAFLLGVVEGDGSVYISDRYSCNTVDISIASASFDFINQLKNEFNLNYIYSYTRKYKEKDSVIYKIAPRFLIEKIELSKKLLLISAKTGILTRKKNALIKIANFR